MAGLTKAEAIAYVQQKIGFRSDLADAILLEMRLQQDLLEQGQSLPWWLRVDSTLAATADLNTITVPDGFIRFDEEVEPWLTDTTTGKRSVLKVMDLDQLLTYTWDEGTSSISTGTIRALAIRGTTFQVAPTPTEAATIYASWYEKDVDLSVLNDGDTNLWLTHAPLVLIGLAGIEVADDIHDAEAVAKMNRIYASANSRMIADIELRKSRTYQVGGEQ